jgi:peptidoglycan/xylan/chitin deacetylase (PgdA/CDA1 family)
MNCFWKKLPKPAQRRMARWFGRRLFRIQPAKPVVSFTFDDFPRSALWNAGATLCERGLSGTYYASFGLMGSTAATGEMFNAKDLEEFIRQRHELACHTFDHYDSWNTAPEEFEASVRRNQRAVSEYLPGLKFKSLSYPISWPRPATKRRISSHFECARGGGQTFNCGSVDLDFLKAFFVEQSREDFETIRRTIETNSRVGGWLIFATHDVCDSPTRFGCTPNFFSKVVECAVASGAEILPVGSAFQRIVHNSGKTVAGNEMLRGSLLRMK